MCFATSLMCSVCHQSACFNYSSSSRIVCVSIVKCLSQSVSHCFYTVCWKWHECVWLARLGCLCTAYSQPCVCLTNCTLIKSLGCLEWPCVIPSTFASHSFNHVFPETNTIRLTAYKKKCALKLNNIQKSYLFIYHVKAYYNIILCVCTTLH